MGWDFGSVHTNHALLRTVKKSALQTQQPNKVLKKLQGQINNYLLGQNNQSVLNSVMFHQDWTEMAMQYLNNIFLHWLY